MPSQPVLGQIMPFAGSVVPKGWALCNGALLEITQNQPLFSLIGTHYGGDGVETFALPDLRGRAILGSTGVSGNYPAGTLSGATTVSLTGAQLPAHNHIIQASTSSGSGRSASPANHIFAVNTVPSGNATKIFLSSGGDEIGLADSTNVMNDGGGQAHNNMQPYLAINYLIATQGRYPSRN